MINGELTCAYLEHHGVKGQKWGVRRYQNEDGSLTELGRKRYGTNITKVSKKFVNSQLKALRDHDLNETAHGRAGTNSGIITRKAQEELRKTTEYKDYEELQNWLLEMQKQASRQHGKNVQLVLDRDLASIYSTTSEKVNKKGREIEEKYRSEFASAMLKDLGYEDTERGRQWLQKKGFVR